MKKIFQIAVQIIFLLVFIFLIIIGKPQLWMGLFLLGIITSFILGRVYCGWFCSINTILKGIVWVKRKLHIKNLKSPGFLTKSWTRYVVLGLFIAVFIFTIVSGNKLPVLPALFLIGILLTFFFHEELWHHYLCPYGSILHLSASKSLHYVNIDPGKCNNCGACKRICPSKAITKNEKNHEIAKNDCLVCMDCITVCKQGAISYK